MNGLIPPYLNELFKSNDTRYNFRDSNRLQQPEFQTVRYGFKSFRYHDSKLWNALPVEVKKSQNLHHFKKNVTQWCASAKCDVFIMQWYTWYICMYIYHIYIYLYIYYSIWNLSHHFIGFICSSVCHFITCNFYWTISLYMWDLWFGMYCLSLISLLCLNPFLFSMFTFPKDKIMLNCFHELYESFGDMNTMHQICDTSTGIFTVYICIWFYWALRVCVYFDVWIWIVHACIYSRKIAVPANVFCWILPDFK